jgi:acetyl-CoA acyltransferase 2
MSGIFIVAAKRTAFGSFGGSLAKVSAVDLGVHATKAALAAANVNPAIVDNCIFGNVIQTGDDAAYLARHVALKSGCAISTPSLTINRLCGSGFESIVQATDQIKVGNSHVVIAGGTENMSAAPLSVDGNDARWGVALGSGLKLKDSLWNGLTDAYAGTPMGITAENLAKQYNITRAECDEYAIRSQQTWAQAQKNGLFIAEIAPIDVKTKKGQKTIDSDEHPRPETLLEKISSLKPVFLKDGVVTAANASGICDGAGSVIVVSEQAMKQHNLTPNCTYS